MADRVYTKLSNRVMVIEGRNLTFAFGENPHSHDIQTSPQQFWTFETTEYGPTFDEWSQAESLGWVDDLEAQLKEV